MLNETLKTIEYRRSIRIFRQTPIEDEIKDKIIHAAIRSPTAGNMMLYSILEVADQKKKDILAISCDNQDFIAKSPLILIFLADMQRWYDYYKISNVKEFCEEHKYHYRTPKESDLFESIADAVIAAQTSVIAAESLGIASCYIGDIIEQVETVKNVLNLPKWVFPAAMLCYGYPKSELEPEKRSLSSRFDEKYIHFIDNYHHLTPDDFSEMHKGKFNAEYPTGKSPKGATNYGQIMYLKKTGSDFSQEMEQSAKIWLKEWING